MKWKRTDPALIFFGVGALACLIVSIPATATAMDLFHGALWGMVATGVFEFGAVGLELMSLWIPQWRGRLLAAMIGMLIITTLFNYATGVDTYIAAKLTTTTTYAAIRAAGYGWLLTIAASALFPAMLGGFLLGFTARARMVRAKLHTPMAAVALWLGVHWRSMAERDGLLAETRQALADRDTLLAEARQTAAMLRHDLAVRPAPETIEVVIVAKHRLTWQQLELAVTELRRLDSVSQTTIRRHVAALAGPDQPGV